MLTNLRNHLTYANVVATVCLFVVLGGTSYAAIALKKNSVKGKHIAANAVTSPKVKNGALLAQDFRAGQLPRGEQGPQGQPGQNGAAGQDGQDGQTGPRGPSNTYANVLNLTGTLSLSDDEFTVGTLTLPAGSYAFTASGAVSGASVTCRIRNQGTQVALGTISHLSGGQSDVMTLSGVATNSGGQATFTCQGNGMGIGATTFRAVQVETLTIQTG